MAKFVANVEYYQGLIGGTIRFVTNTLGGMETIPNAKGPDIAELHKLEFPRDMEFTTELRETGPLGILTQVITEYKVK